MRWLEQVLAHRNSDRPMVEVCAAGAAPRATLSYRSVFDAAIALAAELSGQAGGTYGTLSVGVLAANAPEWVVADLACLLGGAVEVSVPLAFGADQARALLRDVDVCLLDATGAARLAAWGDSVLPEGAVRRRVVVSELAPAGRGRRAPRPSPEDWVCKVVYTSGTTSSPKSVRIRAGGLDEVLCAMDRHFPREPDRRCLSVVPMSQLIEQVVTGYLTMLGAGTLVLLPPEVPLLGTAPGALPAILAAIPRARPTAMQGPPPLFEAFAQVAEAYPDASPTALSRLLFGRPDPAFLGCGGAPVSHRVLTALRDRGITVYEGYCLSESTSVVASNTPAGYRLGSVGQPLPHVELRIADDDELLVRSSSLFAGYAGGPDPAGCPVDSDGWLATGDLAAIDQDGFLYIRGRKKNVVTTSTGRNVAADWIAARYRELPDVVTAVVFGDGLEELVGFFVISDSVDEVELRADIGEYGAARLSEIERVRRIETVRAGDPRVRHLFTVTGRPHRDRIWRLLSNNPNR